MKKFYAICPGKIMSRYDKQVHYISAGQLARLYGVDIRKCVVIDRSRPESFLGRDLSKYTMLSPRYNGNYNKIITS